MDVDSVAGPGPSPGLNWSTDGQRRPFDYWRETIVQVYTALSPQRLGEAPFHGRIDLTPLSAETSISSIQSGPQIVHRTKSDIARRPCDAVFVNFQLSGRSVVTQRGIKAVMNPGSLVLLDATEPFSMVFDRPFGQVCLHLPHAHLKDQGLDARSALARVVPRRSAFAAPLHSAVRHLQTGTLTARDLPAITNLLKLGVDGVKKDTVADQHLELIKSFVEDNLADPSLSPNAIAGHFRISVRHLHKLFARGGTTCGQYLLTARLERGRRMLEIDFETPIGELAAMSGFGSQAHFSRAFRASYGIAPRELRKARRLTTCALRL